MSTVLGMSPDAGTHYIIDSVDGKNVATLKFKNDEHGAEAAFRNEVLRIANILDVRLDHKVVEDAIRQRLWSPDAQHRVTMMIMNVD